MKKDIYRLPRIDDLLDRLAGAKVLSALDLAYGYHQIAIAPGHEHKMAFITRYGLFKYCVLPLGLCNAPSTFSRLMNSVFHDYPDKFVLTCLDDLLVFSNSKAEHEVHLRQTLQRLREHRLQAKLKKCEFGKRKVKYLGHVVGSGKLSVDSDKVSAVSTWEAPKDVWGVQ